MRALSIAAVSLTASTKPSNCIFLPPIRWADHFFRLGSFGGCGFGSPSCRLPSAAIDGCGLTTVTL
jgi:hypothetical protein